MSSLNNTPPTQDVDSPPSAHRTPCKTIICEVKTPVRDNPAPPLPPPSEGKETSVPVGDDKTKEEEEEDDTIMCLSCYDGVHVGDRIVQSCCKKVFHRQCLGRWGNVMGNYCPYCKRVYCLDTDDTNLSLYPFLLLTPLVFPRSVTEEMNLMDQPCRLTTQNVQAYGPLTLNSSYTLLTSLYPAHLPPPWYLLVTRDMVPTARVDGLGTLETLDVIRWLKGKKIFHYFKTRIGGERELDRLILYHPPLLHSPGTLYITLFYHQPLMTLEETTVDRQALTDTDMTDSDSPTFPPSSSSLPCTCGEDEQDQHCVQCNAEDPSDSQASTLYPNHSQELNDKLHQLEDRMRFYVNKLSKLEEECLDSIDACMEQCEEFSEEWLEVINLRVAVKLMMGNVQGVITHVTNLFKKREAHLI